MNWTRDDIANLMITEKTTLFIRQEIDNMKYDIKYFASQKPSNSSFKSKNEQYKFKARSIFMSELKLFVKLCLLFSFVENFNRFD